MPPMIVPLTIRRYITVAVQENNLTLAWTNESTTFEIMGTAATTCRVVKMGISTSIDIPARALYYSNQNSRQEIQSQTQSKSSVRKHLGNGSRSNDPRCSSSRRSGQHHHQLPSNEGIGGRRKLHPLLLGERSTGFGKLLTHKDKQGPSLVSDNQTQSTPEPPNIEVNATNDITPEPKPMY